MVLCLLLLSACGSSEPAPTPKPELTAQERLGAEVYTRNCAACHLLTPNDKKVGPSLHGVASRAGKRVSSQDAQTYLLQSVLNPGDYVVEEFDNLMPQGLAKVLTSEELDAVVAYMLTLHE